MLRFSKHPEKYPLEFRYKIARQELTTIFKQFHVDYFFKNFDKFTKNKEKSLLISNHLSFLDPIMIIVQSEKPVTFVAKKEIFKMPFVKHVAKAIEVFPLDRENIMTQVTAIKSIVSYLRDPNKPSVIIYIEGQRNFNPETPCLDFHAGTLKIASRANCPIMVGATYGGFRVLNKNCWLKRYPVYFSIFDEINMDEFKKYTTNDLAEILRKKVDNEVDLIRAEDKKYILNQKVSKKVKELETRVDARAKA